MSMGEERHGGEGDGLPRPTHEKRERPKFHVTTISCRYIFFLLAMYFGNHRIMIT